MDITNKEFFSKKLIVEINNIERISKNIGKRDNRRNEKKYGINFKRKRERR